MAYRPVYLARSGGGRQRAHFAVFIPNADIAHRDISKDFQSASTKGTIIHVIGEPVMNGYKLEIKRNYECSTSTDLKSLVRLGQADENSLYNPSTNTFVRGDNPRGPLEREAVNIPPPPGGQDVRAPIDGVNTRRCQEWTMDYLKQLEDKSLISDGAVETAQEYRDPAEHGIFGHPPAPQQQPAQQRAGPASAQSQHPASQESEWMSDEGTRSTGTGMGPSGCGSSSD